MREYNIYCQEIDEGNLEIVLELPTELLALAGFREEDGILCDISSCVEDTEHAVYLRLVIV